MTLPLKSLADVPFLAPFVEALPGDPLVENRNRQVHEAAYSLTTPTPVRAPQLLAWSDELAAELGLLRPQGSDDPGLAYLAGNLVPPGAKPFAAAYGGHQFGNWAGQLGDGRAISLGNILAPDGASWELQLKGPGPTPYSRRGDGRAVLRSSLREFVCSEAMFHLGVPTTRALSLVGTGDLVVRDMFYDGRPEQEPGAIVCRVSPSFVRFGNFELPATRGEHDLLRQLADHVLTSFYPQFGPPSPEAYLAMFGEVCERTALLMAQWLRVGFVHGVMNTDNMSILGLTIDYGPYGWLEGYEPNWTPNTTDAQGRRYCFGRQASIALWNLARLAEALIPLVGSAGELEAALGRYRSRFAATHKAFMAQKLGLAELEGLADEELASELGEVLQLAEIDMTRFHRSLAALPVGADAEGLSDEALWAPLRSAWYAPEAFSPESLARFAAWLRCYAARAGASGLSPEARAEAMRLANPKYVPRNYLAQVAIDAAEAGDLAPLERLMGVLKRPYDEQPEAEDLAGLRPEWARHRPGCSALSCSS